MLVRKQNDFVLIKSHSQGAQSTPLVASGLAVISHLCFLVDKSSLFSSRIANMTG